MEKRSHNAFNLGRNGSNQQPYNMPYYRSIDLNDQKPNDLSTYSNQQQHSSTIDYRDGFNRRPEQQSYQPPQQITHSIDLTTNEFDDRYKLSNNRIQFNRSTVNNQQQARTYGQDFDRFHNNGDTRSAEQTFNSTGNQLQMPTNIHAFLPRFMIDNSNLFNDQNLMKAGGGSSSQQWSNNLQPQSHLQQFKQPDEPLRTYYTSSDTIGNSSSSKYSGNRDSSDNRPRQMSSNISNYNDIDYRRTLDLMNFGSSTNNLNMENYRGGGGDPLNRYFNRDDFHSSVANSGAVNLVSADTRVTLNSTAIENPNAITSKVLSSSDKYKDYVEITDSQRKELRKKWRKHIRSTDAPRSREDYARWFKNEIKNDLGLVKSKEVQHQRNYDPDDRNSSEASSSSFPMVSDNISTNASCTIVRQTANPDKDEQLYAEMTAIQRKIIRNKWRKYIRTENATTSRTDYVKFVKSEIERIKNEPEQRESHKRNRSPDDNSNRNECNKRRRDGTNFSHLLREMVALAKMVIVHSDYPLSIIDAIQADLIKNSLLMALEEETELAPNFKEIRHSGGAVHVACLNEESKQWIEKVVPKIQPWKHAKLKAISNDELVKYVKAVVYIPYSDITRDTILHRLAIQNRGLNTSIWRIIRMTTEKIGQTMVVLVDEESAEYLKTKNLTVGLNFTQVKFRFTKKNEANPVNKETNEHQKSTQEATTFGWSRVKTESSAERSSRDRYSSNRNRRESSRDRRERSRERSRDRRERSRDGRSRNYAPRNDSSRHRRRSSRD